MEILTLNSKVKIGCKICDKCCEYRGNIKITSINVCMISKFLKISPKEFIEKYTHEVEGEFPEIALNGVGKKRVCILNNPENFKCMIHKVRPMQCAMFPLVPENLSQDFFLNSGQCQYDEQKEMTVKKWLDGRRGVYMRYKDFYIKWIAVMEEIQFRSSHLNEEARVYIRKLLYEDFDLKKNIKKQCEKNLNEVIKFTMNDFRLT